MKKTHVSVGLALTLPIILNAPISVIGLLGSTAPDLDIQLGLKHRTITHSLLFLGITTLVITPFSVKISLVWFVNYLLHLLLDGMTVSGVPLLYPKKKSYGIKKIKTGGAEDYFLQILAIAFILLIYLA